MGPELPAGTVFEVLGVDPDVRREIPGALDEGVMTRVRVQSNIHQSGWTFIRYTELAIDCPILIASTDHSPPYVPSAQCVAPTDEPTMSYAARGPRRNRARLLACEEYEHPEVLERADVDSDGVADEVLRVGRGCMHLTASAPQGMSTSDETGAIVAFLRRADAWMGADVLWTSEASRGSHGENVFEDTIHAGGALYFRARSSDGSDSGWCVDLPARVTHRPVGTSFTRVDACGVAHRVAHLAEPLSGGCTWIGTPDEGVELRCREPARSISFRWDSSRFSLVTDAPRMPLATSDAPLCRHSYD